MGEPGAKDGVMAGYRPMYQVDTAIYGREGVKMAEGVIPDLIISDITMPELDGYGVLKNLSRNPDSSAIPFIFLTAKSEK